MEKITNWLSIHQLFFFVFIALSPLACQAVDIVANVSVSTDGFSKNDLRSIFAMTNRYWPDGQEIKVFVLHDDHLVHRKFTRGKLGMFPHQLRRVWDRFVFSGTGQAPIELDSQNEMIEKIKNTPYAIGYAQDLPVDKSIKVITYE